MINGYVSLSDEIASTINKMWAELISDNEVNRTTTFYIKDAYKHFFNLQNSGKGVIISQHYISFYAGSFSFPLIWTIINTTIGDYPDSLFLDTTYIGGLSFSPVKINIMTSPQSPDSITVSILITQ